MSSKKTHQATQQSLIKCIKVQNRLGTSELIEAIQDQLNEFILSKSFGEAVLRNHYVIRQNKRPSAHKFRIK